MQEPDIDDTKPRSVAKILNNELSRKKSRFVDFSVVYHPLSENQTTDSLAKVSKEYHIDFIILVVIYSGLVFYTTSNLSIDEPMLKKSKITIPKTKIVAFQAFTFSRIMKLGITTIH